ncbi:MAG: hypothetical protein AAGA77_01775 [Bacteroidota bacterium]
MKTLLFVVFVLIIGSNTLKGQYDYEPSAEHPFGLPNPAAPIEIKDYHPLIGICTCKSEARNQDGSWQDPEDMTWEFKYIMNGMGVQDQTLKEDGGHSGSIRQYIPDSSQWYVHYYSSKSPTPSLSTWSGGKAGNEIILYRSQKAPNGMEGKYKITFSNISDLGFNWLGEWVNPDESIKYPTWKIECKKKE